MKNIVSLQLGGTGGKPEPIVRVVEFSRIQVPNVKTYVFLRYKFPNFNFRTWRIAHTSIYRNFHDRQKYIRDWDLKIVKLFAKNQI